ncbi:MAG: hypothetical protein ACLQAT_00500 [Candidatus Binataceae bacterium]
MTYTENYDISGLDASLVDHIASTIRIGCATLQSLAIDEDSGTLSIVASDAGAIEYVNGFVAHVRGTRKKLRSKVLLANSAASMFDGDIDAELARSGDLLELDAGLAGLRGETLGLFRFFEREFAAMARQYEAQEHHYPVMLPVRILEELKYFEHFPQQVTFCAHLPEDLPMLEEIAGEVHANEGRLSPALRSRLAPPAHALKPAVCIPCYRQYRGSQVPDDGMAVTMQNHVFRYEGANFRSLGRLWDFSVRDIVFFGERQAVENLRRDAVERAMALCRELDLEARVQLANDPFFLDQSRDKRVYQRMGEVKYELVLPLPHRGGEELAVSSFNLHRDFYSGVYKIHLAGGATAETACVGFGLERWLYGFVSQKGLDPSRWPSRVSEFVQTSEPLKRQG